VFCFKKKKNVVSGNTKGLNMPNIERVGKPPSLIYPPKTNPKNT
jgi:hypothetical protein